MNNPIDGSEIEDAFDEGYWARYQDVPSAMNPYPCGSESRYFRDRWSEGWNRCHEELQSENLLQPEGCGSR